MKEFDDIFLNEEISNYEKSILYYALNSIVTGMYDINQTVINQLADLLSISLDNLEKILKLSIGSQVDYCDYNDYFSKLDIKYHTYDSLFFQNIYLYLKIENQICEWNDGFETSDLSENRNLLISMNTNFLMFQKNINLILIKYEKKAFIANELITYPTESLDLYKNIYETILVAKLSGINNNAKLELFFDMFIYEITKKLDSMYILFISIMIFHSPFIDESFKHISLKFRNELLPVLSDTKLISFRINSMYQNISMHSDERTKSNSETTRLLFIYGFSNFDSYFLRLDLKHKGQEYIHFNNNSPGGRKSILLAEQEYNNLIVKYPKIKDCFVGYSNNRFMLKEKINLNVSQDLLEVIEDFESRYSHRYIFEDETESSVVEFIDLFIQYMPTKFYSKIDKENEYAFKCTRFNKLMYHIYYLFQFEYYNQLFDFDEALEKIFFKKIIEYAFAIGYIDKIDEEYFNIEYIKMIIADARSNL